MFYSYVYTPQMSCSHIYALLTNHNLSVVFVCDCLTLLFSEFVAEVDSKFLRR